MCPREVQSPLVQMLRTCVKGDVFSSSWTVSFEFTSLDREAGSDQASHRNLWLTGWWIAVRGGAEEEKR